MNENFDFNSVKNTSNLSDTVLTEHVRLQLKNIVQHCFCAATETIEEDGNTISVVLKLLDDSVHKDSYQRIYDFVVMSLYEVTIYVYGGWIPLTREFLEYVNKNQIIFTFKYKRTDGCEVQFYNHKVNDYTHFVPLTQELLNKFNFFWSGFSDYCIYGVVFSDLNEYLQLTKYFYYLQLRKHETSIYGDDIKILNDDKTDILVYTDNRRDYSDPTNVVVSIYDDHKRKIYNETNESLCEDLDFNNIKTYNTSLTNAILDNCMNSDELPEDKEQFEFFVDVAHKFKNVFDKWNDGKKSQWEYKPEYNWLQFWNADASEPYAHIMYKKNRIEKISFQNQDFPISWLQSICYYKYEFFRLLYNELKDHIYTYTRIISSNYQVKTLRNNDFIIGFDFEGVLDLSNLKKVVMFIYNSIPILGYSQIRVDIKGVENMNDELLHTICDVLTNYWVKVNGSNSLGSELTQKISLMCSKINFPIGAYDDENGQKILYEQNIKTVNRKFNEVLKKNNIPLSDIRFVCDCPKFAIMKRTMGWDLTDFVIEFKYFFIYNEKSCTIAFLKIVSTTNIKQINAARWETKVEIYQ